MHVFYESFRSRYVPLLIVIYFFIGIFSLNAQEILTDHTLKISDIEFIRKDSAFFDEASLKNAVGISKVDVYNQKVLGNDIFKLERYYFDNGFFDAKVDTLVKYDLENRKVLIQFIIEQRNRFMISELTLSGLDKISEKLNHNIDSLSVIKDGDYYNKVLIIQQGNIITDMLQNNGYMNARLKEDSGTVVTKHDGKVSILINFEMADTIFYFGKTRINIKDNNYEVENYIFERMITYSEGEMYSKAVKLQTERNMLKYAIVQSARLAVDEQSGDKVDFVANISLTNKYDVIPYITGATIDNIFYLGGGAQYINKYFWKGGKVLNLNALALFNSIRFNRFELSAALTQPYLFNYRSNLTNKVTLGIYNQEQFRNYYAGNLTTVGYYISDHTFYQSASLDLNEEVILFQYSEPVDSTLKLFNSTLSVTGLHDETNDQFNPSKGFYHSLTLGHSGLIPKLIINSFDVNINYSEYFKGYTINKLFFKLGDKSSSAIFATVLKIGDIIEYGEGEKLVPVQPIYKFFSGGSSSLRGWTAKSNGILANTENGGDFLIEGSLELRKRLFPDATGFKKNIGAAVFFDYGNVWEKQSEFKANQIAMAIGFGLRYDLFIGPVRIDVGFKLYDPSNPVDKWLFNNTSEIFKSKMAIHFGIGQAF
ncbi:N/A [soil metagenome]